MSSARNTIETVFCLGETKFRRPLLNPPSQRVTNRQMTNDDIAYLRLLADWHDRQADYLLLTVPAGQHDQGRFHFIAAARLSRLADEATMSRSGGEAATVTPPLGKCSA
jgi:hypothetical protein